MATSQARKHRAVNADAESCPSQPRMGSHAVCPYHLVILHTGWRRRLKDGPALPFHDAVAGWSLSLMPARQTRKYAVVLSRPSEFP